MNDYKGKVRYIFEAGHKSQSTANKLMVTPFSQPELREGYRCQAFGFMDKTDAGAIQAAGLLAWQYFTDRKRELAGKVRRKDMTALLGIENLVRHIDVPRHASMVREAMVAFSSEQSGQ